MNHESSEAIAYIFIEILISYVLTQKMMHGDAIAPMDESVMVDSLISLVVR
ncbi:MAG: hypothetical protein WA949_03695 [Phormidesmis sp.]